MTTTFWNANTGKSVPSGGAVQLTTAGSQGSNLGNWFSKLQSTASEYVSDKSNLIRIGIIVAAIIFLTFLLKKKRK